MSSVNEYLKKAAELDRLASEAKQPSLTRRYADLADCYRLLADERKRLIDVGEITAK